MRTLYTLLLVVCWISVSHAQFCSGTTILNDCSGSFDDGSGNAQYANNSICNWLIQVPVDSTIIMFFNSFQTESCCDDLRIYNGSSSNAPLIGAYFGNSLPNLIQSSSNELFLEFTSDGSVTANGWSANYMCNNSSFIELEFNDPGFADLMAADGSVLDYEVEIRNNGNMDSGPFDVGFYASMDNVMDISDPLMLREAISNIPANTSVTLSGLLDVRDSIPPGVYDLVGFIIDPQNQVDELVEGNNIYEENFEQIYIPYCSELTTIIGCQGSFNDGSGFENVVRESHCSWLLESQNNESIYLDFVDVDLFSNDVISIYDGANQNATFIQEFRGDDDFYPIVSSGGSLYFEFDVSFSTNDGWNAEYFCTDTSIANMIMELSSNANSTGSIVDFDLNIRNNGNAASPATKIYFFGSLDNNFNLAQDFLIDSIEISSIPAYDQFQLNYMLDARDIIPSGEYYPIAVIDAFDSVVELNEEDNLEIFNDRFYIPYCSDTTTWLTACSGVFSDGSGNNGILPGSDCSWLLEAGPGEFVSLNLIDADLGLSSTSIRFYDGDNNLSQLIADFTGSTDDEIPSTILSTGENIYVEFMTSSNTAFGSGWSFQYGCTQDIEVNFEFVEDFNIVNLFNDEVRYNFNVQNFGNGSTPVNKVYFFLSPDQVVNTNDIILDSITLPSLQAYQSFNVNHVMNPRLLDPSIPGGVYYAGFFIDPLDEVVEIKEDDNSFINNNFLAIPFCSDAPIIIDDCFGQFDDGSGNNDYANNSDCVWLVEGPVGSNIRLAFNAFETESCCDYVRIYDGNNNNAPLIGDFSGTTLPPLVQTTQSFAYLEFDTDGSSTRSGWEIDYECIEYFSNLRFKNASSQFQIVDKELSWATVIENNGVLPTGEFQMGFLLSVDEIPNIGDFILETKTINSIGPGDEIMDMSMFDISNLPIPTGTYFLIARLDLGEIVEENDEMDNDFVSSFPIDITSSTEDVFNESGLVIFVNNQDILVENNFEHHVNRISLIRTNGQILLDRGIDNSNSEYKLNVMDYPTGLYLLRVELENQILVKKLIVP